MSPRCSAFRPACYFNTEGERKCYRRVREILALTVAAGCLHGRDMGRTTVVLDTELLHAAGRALGTRSCSDTVNHALLEVVRAAQVRGLLDLIGTDAWSGDLSAMREDRAPAKGTRTRT